MTAIPAIYAQSKRKLVDADAQAFFDATGITDTAIKTAIDQFVKDLKTNVLWDSFDALYPFVGGTANSHKYNLRNPADTNGAFRITWGGSVTHDNGIKGNGTNAWGDTHYAITNWSTVFAAKGGAMSAFVQERTTATGRYVLGCRHASGDVTGLNLPLANPSVAADGATAQSNLNANGNYHLERENNSLRLYVDGILRATTTAAQPTYGPTTLSLLALRANSEIGGAPFLFSDARLLFASISSFTIGDGNISQFNSLVAQLQTTLGRV